MDLKIGPISMQNYFFRAARQRAKLWREGVKNVIFALI